jgi:Cu-Zn family superoxide dismutase
MRSLCTLCVVTCLLAGCGQREESAAPANSRVVAPTATASVQLAPTQGNTASGSLTLTAADNAVALSGTIQGLAPNAEFGFHIHEKGDCSAPDASSAGAHFNPANSQHGDPAGESHHAGDMHNAKSDAQGVAMIEAQVSGVSLGSGQPDDVLGKAVVLHEKADDFTTQPSGDSGARIACGVIAMNPWTGLSE